MIFVLTSTESNLLDKSYLFLSLSLWLSLSSLSFCLSLTHTHSLSLSLSLYLTLSALSLHNTQGFTLELVFGSVLDLCTFVSFSKHVYDNELITDMKL